MWCPYASANVHLLGDLSVQAVCKKLSTEAKKLGDENLDLRSVSRPSDVSSKCFFRDLPTTSCQGLEFGGGRLARSCVWDHRFVIRVVDGKLESASTQRLLHSVGFRL